MNLNIGNIENLFQSINSVFNNENDMNLKQGQKLMQYNDLYKDNVLKNIKMMKPLELSNETELMTIREAVDGKDSTQTNSKVLTDKLNATEKEFNITLAEYSNTYKFFIDDLMKKSKSLDNAKKYLDNNISSDNNRYIYVNKFGFTHRYLTNDSWKNKDKTCPKTNIKMKELEKDKSNFNYLVSQKGPDIGLGQACKIAGQNIQNKKTKEIAWVDIKGYKHKYTDSIWKSKLESCGKYNPIKLSEKAYNNIPSGSPMTETTLCSQLNIDPVIWTKLSSLNQKLISLANTIVEDMGKINISNSNIKQRINDKQLLLNDYIKQLNDDKNNIIDSKSIEIIEGKYKDSNTNLKYNESRYIIWIILAIFVFLMLFRFMNSDDSNASTPLLVLALLVGLYVFLRK
jgi:hypothetical protein